MEWIDFWDAGKEQTIQVDKIPESCPYCQLQIDAKSRNGSYFVKREPTTPQPHLFVEVVFECPSHKCGRLFVCVYDGGRSPEPKLYELIETVPKMWRTHEFTPFIRDISSSFCDIWKQASQAEQAGLIEVCGMGFRKALEFLVKDYLIEHNPDQKEAILKSFLGPCISQRIDHPKIKACAERAAWLGNDETHYLRKWENKDVADLKKLIELTIHWMEMESLTEHYEGEMPDRK